MFLGELFAAPKHTASALLLWVAWLQPPHTPCNQNKFWTGVLVSGIVVGGLVSANVAKY